MVVINWMAILGGFAFFLFGIQYMGEALKNIAGSKLREYIEKYTNKPWKGIIVGALITTFIQSSSGTTAIAIGFVRAGLMRLSQVIGIIMGANIGTTVTAFLIGLKIEKYALIFVFLGVLFLIFSHKKQGKHIGEIILGFGILFFGLHLMGGELAKFKSLPEFSQFALAVSNHPMLALLVGIVITGLIQSSSAVIGIVQTIASSGALPMIAAVPIIFGSNIGTTITSIIAALGGSISAKRAAGIHVFFNVLGTAIFMIILIPFTQFIVAMGARYNISVAMQLAIAHIIFNIVTTIITYPLIPWLVKTIKRIIRGDEERIIDIGEETLDTSLAHSLPSAALVIARDKTSQMGGLALEMLNETKLYLTTGSRKHYDSSLQLEDGINSMDEKITNYLIEIGNSGVGLDENIEYIECLQVLKQIERIGDLSRNLVVYYDSAFEGKEFFSEIAIHDILVMYDLTYEMISLSLDYFKEKDEAKVVKIFSDEKELNQLEKVSRKKHFKRLSKSECTNGPAGILFLDILSTIERIGDHGINIIRSGSEVPLHGESVD